MTLRYALLLVLAAPAAYGAEIRYDISGVPEPLAANVRSHLNQFGIAGGARISARRFEALRDDVQDRVRDALKPYGYYSPEITTNLAPAGEENWRMRIRIRPGEPVRVTEAVIDVTGAGSENRELRAWLQNWPLPVGSILNQPAWSEQKQRAISIAETSGYLQAQFSRQSIAIDRAENSARLELVLDTGSQARFGTVTYEQDVLRPWVLENVPRFEPGEPYSAELLEQFRLDLWRAVLHRYRGARGAPAARTPPVVDLHARLSSDYRDTYQGTVGIGTDTGIRLQGLWSRHRLSPRGDRMDVGTGYREIDDEFSVRTDYRIPRRSAKRQFWVASANLRSENQDLEFKRQQQDEGFIKLATGQVDNLRARFGRLHVRDRDRGFEQVLETIYTELIRESFVYSPGDDAAPEVQAVANDPAFSRLFSDTVTSIAFGIEWDWPALSGSGFATHGHRERAWLFTANEAWGSGRDYTQAYISTRRGYLFERLVSELLLRGEVGYSNADVQELTRRTSTGDPFFAVGDQGLPGCLVAVPGGRQQQRARLPFRGAQQQRYRLQQYRHCERRSRIPAERQMVGCRVRGYRQRIQRLGTSVDLRAGRRAGFGLRWYTVAGAIRLDLARGLDIEGRPLRVHFTVGSPLLW
ncbi:MAG: POTRA domain-containing protein [Woeseiaceae bacterium]|nr:POTRA domain-containing protein [Woeseiaceae bacterium]